MDNNKEIEVLNSLVEINNDRIEDYENAIDETDSDSLKDMFLKFKKTSETCKQQLADEIRKCGGFVEVDTKTSGKLYRVYMDLKATVTGKDQKVILDSCETGEDKALETYENVLDNKSGNLHPDHINLVRSQYYKIKKDHDTVKEMRESKLVDCY